MEEKKKLQLNWCVPQYLPISPQSDQYESLFRVYEYLDYRQFSDEEQMSNYWSFPEILLELRWLAQRSGSMEKNQDQEYFNTHGGMANVYSHMIESTGSIVSLLGYHAAIYHRVNTVIEDVYTQKQEYIDYWIQWHDKLEWDYSAVNGLVPENIQRIIMNFPAILEEMDSFPIYSEVRSVSQTLLELVYSGWEFDNEVRQKVIELYTQFKDLASQFFAQYLNEEKEQKAETELYDLADWIQKALINYGDEMRLPTKDKWNREYRESVWSGLQRVADCVCRSFYAEKPQLCYFTKHNLQTYNLVSTVADLMKVLEEAFNRLNVKSRYFDQLLNGQLTGKFLKQPDRCVALLEYGSERPLVSFSGFFDIPNTTPSQTIYKVLSEDGNGPLCVFIRIAKALKWELVQVTDELAEQIKYIDTIGRQCCTLAEAVEQFNKEMESLDADSQISEKEKKTRKNELKDKYSCCERKMLAYLDCTSRDDPMTMNFLIKKVPCKKCRPIIGKWWNEHLGVRELTIKYITERGSECCERSLR